MARSARSTFERNPLRLRLVALRRRLRLVVTTRGISWLLAVVLLTAMIAGTLDFAWHLPALVRGFLLVGLLSGAGLVGLLFLLKPLLDRMDDLTLALRIEERYPSLNDSLASTIQFLEQAEKKSLGEDTGPGMKDSLAMRREAARRAMQKASGCDFNRIIDTNGLRTAAALGVGAVVAAVVLCWLHPARAATAVARLIDPFGTHAWPTATSIELDKYRERIGKTEIFELRGRLKGVIPTNAQVLCRFDGSTPETHEVRVTQEADGQGRFQTLLRPSQQARSFTFQVKANDAATEWIRIEVAPAPALTALQTTLFFPEYTGLSHRTLPENNGNIDAIAGTIVNLKATASVPLKRAWIEYHPESPGGALTAFLSPLAADGAASLLATSAVAQDVAGRHEARLSEDRKTLHLRFLPNITGQGTYSLHLEDDTNLASARTYELRLRPDPSPVVALERPSPLKELLEVLPNAVLPLRVSVDDPEFGIRSVWLEYRVNDERFRRLPLYHPGMAANNPAVMMASPLIPAATSRMKPTHHVVEGRLPLSQLRHEDGTAPRTGDAITLRALADDFDTVTPHKAPGTSSYVEIRVVTRSALEVVLNAEQAKIQQDLVDLRNQQRDALRKVNEIENRVARTKTLTPEDRAELTRAEQTQQQIRERLEAQDQESVRGRVERILETLRENELKDSGVQGRMENVQRDLDRIGKEELQQIEAALTETQKRAEGTEDKSNPAVKALEQAAEKSERQARELEQLAADKNREQADRNKLSAEAQKLKDQAKQLREMANEARKETNPESPEAEARSQERSRQLQQMAEDRERLSRELENAARRDNSGKVEDLLRQAREQREAARALREEARAEAEPRKRERPDAKASLTDARRRQEEVDKTLGEVLQRLEPWSTTREVKNEANAILEGQRKLNEEVEALLQQELQRNEPKPEDKARIENAAAAQKKLRERLEELTDKMRRISEDRKAGDPATAEEMKQALETIQKGEIASKMKEALDALGPNQLGKAATEQGKALKELEKLVKQMEDRREAELGRNIDELRKAERKLEELAAEQDLLRKKVKEAEQIADPKKREDALKKLAREQKELQEKTQEAARQLAGMRANRASQTAGQAAKQMEEAVRRLERGEAPNEQQEEALDRLDEAADDAAKERGKNEEELARELMDRVADVIKRIKERHDRLLAETGRLHQQAQERKEWDRLLQSDLTGLAESQKLLAEETRTVAERDLGGAEVFSRQLLRAADAMKKAAEALAAHFNKVKARSDDLSPPAEAERLQKQAQRRLQALLDALKPDDNKDGNKANRGAQKPQGGGGNGGENGGGGGSRRPGDGIPPMAQLKLLRSMQAEVNERTKELSDKKADPPKLTDEEKKELDDLQREQRAIADLIEEYSRPPMQDEGEKK